MIGAEAPRLLRALLPRERCASWLSEINALDTRLPADHAERQPTSGSLRLRALGEGRFAAIVNELMALLAMRPIEGATLRGVRFELLREACWVRRQHAPARRPPGQYPHAWHQDGALGSDFAPGARLRQLFTLWLPLGDCGVDAPSLGWIDVHATELLSPAELTDSALATRFGLGSRQHAVLAAGDALWFGGGLIHRTHVEAEMTRPRVSVELRFAPR